MILKDFHHVKNYLNTKHGRVFGEDSLIEQGWEAKAEHNDVYFDAHLPFGCEEEPADDMGHDGVLLVNMSIDDGGDNKKYKVLIVELRSIQRLVAAEKPKKKVLLDDDFVSPRKLPAAPRCKSLLCFLRFSTQK